jgi:hypothetical protein
MAGVDSSTISTDLTRTNLWNDQLKDILIDILQGQQYVNWMSNFPDGTTFNIPSIGELPMRTVNENDPVVYDTIDTGNFTFTINNYVEAATYITDKAKQDSYYSDQLIAAFLPKMKRAIEENLETNIFNLANSQTQANPNSINGVAHRMIASGATNTQLAIADFARMKLAMDKANASARRIAIIDPSQEYVLNTLTNITALTNANAQFDGIVQEGFVNSTTGLRFSKNIFGFDVYVSNYLSAPTSTGAINADSRGSVSCPSSPIQNIFMSVGGDETPFKGAWRQMVRVEQERNKDLRRDEYVMNGRYGLKLYRPECLGVVISTTNV